MSTRWEASPRQARRNLLLLVGAVPSVAALAVAIALLLMLWRQAAGVAATDAGEHGAARERFAANRWFGTVQHWVAPYNEGVATFREGDPAGAVTDFVAALEVAPTDAECVVLHNLAVAREAVADDSGGDAALAGYRSAREDLARARCLDRDPGSAVLDDRLVEKIETILERREKDELAALTEREREEVAKRSRLDAMAEQRDRRNEEAPDDEPPPDQDYGW